MRGRGANEQRSPSPRAAGPAVSPATDAAAPSAFRRPRPMHLSDGSGTVALRPACSPQDEHRDDAEDERLLAEEAQDGVAQRGSRRWRVRARPRPTAPSILPTSRTPILVITVAREAIKGRAARGATDIPTIADTVPAIRSRPAWRPRAEGQLAAASAAGAASDPWARPPRRSMGVQRRARATNRACVIGATPHTQTVDWSVDLPTHTRRMSAHGEASGYGHGRKQQGAVRPHVQLSLTPAIFASHASRHLLNSPVDSPRRSRARRGECI